MTLVARAPGKVNLTLYVGRPRPDGYHPLVSVVQPVSLSDELRLEPAAGDRDEVVCAGVEGDNLALRALELYRQESGWRAGPQRLTITKRVPVAAGMGGGSADAAAALRLAAFAAHRPGDPLIEEIAPRLGADVPSQVEPRRVLMSGIGEHVESLPAPATVFFVIVPSDETLSTPAVYAEFDRLGLGRGEAELAELADELRASRAAPAVNDLEAAALSLCPSIADDLDALREQGAHAAMVSGSGPTVFGVFPSAERADAAAERILGAVPAAAVGPAFSAPARA